MVDDYRGWEMVGISRFLHVSRPTVDAWIRRFETEYLAGLVDKSRAPKAPVRKIWLPLMVQVYHLQKAHPDAGAFRIWGLLARSDVSVRTVGRVVALNRLMLEQRHQAFLQLYNTTSHQGLLKDHRSPTIPVEVSERGLKRRRRAKRFPRRRILASGHSVALVCPWRSSSWRQRCRRPVHPPRACDAIPPQGRTPPWAWGMRRMIAARQAPSAADQGALDRPPPASPA